MSQDGDDEIFIHELKDRSPFTGGMTKNQLQAYYTGGACYELARYIYEMTLWPIIEISGTRNWDDTRIKRTWYHFTNWHPATRMHVDAFGLSTTNALLSHFEWDREYDEIQVVCRDLDYLIAAGSQERDMYLPDWFDNAVMATKTLGLDKLIEMR